MTVATRDRRFFRRQALTALLLMAFPYLVLVTLAPKGTIYTGALFNPNDTFLYYAQMARAQQGAWLFHDYFTYIQEPPLLAYTLYSAIGHLIPAWSGVAGLAAGYHFARLALAATFTWQAWLLYGEASASRTVRRVGFLFLLFTSGAGVYQLLFPPFRGQEPPFDLLVTESSTFAGLAFSPHFAAVLLGMVVYMRMLLRLGRPDEGRRWKAALVGATASLVVTSIHPDKAGVLGVGTVAFVAWLGWSRRSGWGTAALGCAMLVPSVPYVLYTYALTASDPQIRSLLAQGLPHESVGDPLVYYGFGFGLPLAFAVATLPRLLRRPRLAPPGEVLMWTFVLAGLVIVLLPFRNVGHRAEGLQVALAFLAGRGLVRVLLPRLWRTRSFRGFATHRPLGYSRRKLRLLTVNLAVILSSTSVLALAFASPRAVLAGSPEAFASADDLAATSWLRTHAGAGDVAVGEGTSAQFLAAYGGVRAAWGSFAYTPDYDSEGQRLAAFYLGRAEPQGYLAQRSIRWVYFGPRERRFARINPDDLPFMRRAFAAGSTSIYEVTSGQALTPDASHRR
ncbi:MAG: hypothetical protein ACR2MY_09995 [Candidatus Dormibacteria bacterium]